MKKHILSFAIATAIIGSIATGCSSNKSATGDTDSAAVDSSTMTTPAATDTMSKDTSGTGRTDTAKTTPPQQ
jgi:hypothetical protein